jgi:effector-binding domain-containing protein
MRGPYDQIPQAFATVYGWLAAEGHTPRGMPVAVYLNDPAAVAPSDALWEVWAPIEDQAAEYGPDDRGLAVRRIPAMTIATTIHTGPYDQVRPAYERLMNWMAERGLQPGGPPMEAYLNDPGEASPDEYLTEIMMPVA